MTADNIIKFIVSQDLTSGEIKIQTEGSKFSYPIAVHMFLVAIKALKDKVISNLEGADIEKLLKMAFVGEAPAELKNNPAEHPEQAIRDYVYLKVEGEMYDLLNLSVSNFLDTEFPRVNSKLSLTEQAAEQAGLDNSATPEELIAAENKFIEDNPELAAQTQELQPKKVLRLPIDKNGKPTAHPSNLAGGSNRATRRLNKK